MDAFANISLPPHRFSLTALTSQVLVQVIQASVGHQNQSDDSTPSHIVEVKPVEVLIGVLGKESATSESESCEREQSPQDCDGDVVDVQTNVDDIADGEDDEGGVHGDQKVCEKGLQRLNIRWMMSLVSVNASEARRVCLISWQFERSNRRGRRQGLYQMRQTCSCQTLLEYLSHN